LSSPVQNLLRLVVYVHAVEERLYGVKEPGLDNKKHAFGSCL